MKFSFQELKSFHLKENEKLEKSAFYSLKCQEKTLKHCTHKAGVIDKINNIKADTIKQSHILQRI